MGTRVRGGTCLGCQRSRGIRTAGKALPSTRTRVATSTASPAFPTLDHQIFGTINAWRKALRVKRNDRNQRQKRLDCMLTFEPAWLTEQGTNLKLDCASCAVPRRSWFFWLECSGSTFVAWYVESSRQILTNSGPGIQQGCRSCSWGCVLPFLQDSMSQFSSLNSTCAENIKYTAYAQNRPKT